MSPEELLLQMTALQEDTTDYCTIDPETRTISVPPKYQLLGVESDEKVKRIWFQCPKIVDDDVDLSKLGIRVNYQNANGAILPYVVSDTKTEGDNVIFSWLLDRSVTAYKGNVRFIVCATKASGDSITNEWNTTLATSQVLEGLEPDTELSEDETDIVKQLIAIATQRLTDVQLATSDAIEATNNAKTATQEAVNATEDARSVIEQITKDSYLHTALETFINEVTAKPTAYGNALVEKIEGYIRQNQPKGYQLIDLNRTVSNTASIYENNGYRIRFANKDGSVRRTQVRTDVLDEGEYTVYFGKAERKTGAETYVVLFSSSTGTSAYLAKTSGLEVVTTFRANGSDYFYVYITSPGENTICDFSMDIAIFKGSLSAEQCKSMLEPYTGGEPAPSPDYPQVIHGVGDMGFFDGELLQGMYSAGDGSYSSANTSVCNANKIPAKQGDIVRIEYEEGNKNLYIIAYDKSGKFLKAYVESSGKSYLSTEALPANTDYVNFNIQSKESASLPVSSAKHITVTINGMYAICVRSHSPNLLDIRGKTGGSAARASVLGETIQITTLEGSGIAPGVFFYLGPITKFLGKRIYIKADKMESTHSAEGKASCRMVIRAVKGGTNVRSYGIYQDSKAGTWMLSAEIPADLDLSTVTELCLQMYVGDGTTQVAVGKTAIFENVMVCWEKTEEYHPYQSNTTYIPISSPLFAGDQLIKRNMEHKTYRKMGFMVFDGDEEPINPIHVDGVGFGCTMAQNVNMDESKKVYSNTFLQIEKWNNGSYGVSVLVNYSKNKQLVFTIPDEILGTSSSTGADEAKTKIKEFFKNNKTIVCYTLQTPTEEELSPEAQKAIHSIMACDEQTTIEIVGVPTDAEVQNQFLLPRNVDGALNTTAFAMSKRNEIALEEQQTATEARLQAIEAQILKEV